MTYSEHELEFTFAKNSNIFIVLGCFRWNLFAVYAVFFIFKDAGKIYKTFKNVKRYKNEKGKTFYICQLYTEQILAN